jgi:hypothetical protein
MAAQERSGTWHAWGVILLFWVTILLVLALMFRVTGCNRTTVKRELRAWTSSRILPLPQARAAYSSAVHFLNPKAHRRYQTASVSTSRTDASGFTPVPATVSTLSTFSTSTPSTPGGLLPKTQRLTVPHVWLEPCPIRLVAKRRFQDGLAFRCHIADQEACYETQGKTNYCLRE